MESERWVAALSARREVLEARMVTLREALGSLAGEAREGSDFGAGLAAANRAVDELDEALRFEGEAPRRGGFFRKS